MAGSAEVSLALDAAVDAAIAACGGDARSAVRALIVANNYLEAEVQRLAEAVSSGFTRGLKANGKAQQSRSNPVSHVANSFTAPTFSVFSQTCSALARMLAPGWSRLAWRWRCGSARATR